MLVVNSSQVRQFARYSGFTLIEVLVTFVILAVGVLGIVSLLSVSKTSEYEAMQRARAVTMADGMLERIRNNPGGLADYITGLEESDAIGCDPDSDPECPSEEPDPNCRTTACGPGDLAAHDLWAWEQVLDGTSVTVTNADASTTPVAGLTDPKGCITFQPWGDWVRSGQLSVLLQWRGLQQSTDGVATGEDACGGDEPGTDKYRRQVTVSTFVIDETEL